MDGLNIIERANKIITFRKYIREECRKKGLDYPSDEKIAEYIADCGGEECVYDLNDFMGDYENKIGVFKDPMDDFKAELALIEWGPDGQPTDEEIAAYVAENGYNVHGFVTHHVINTYKGFEKATLLRALALDDAELVKLWNKFIEEGALYGADSYIYDLEKGDDRIFLTNHMPKDLRAELTRKINNAKLHGNEVRFVQWFALNDNSVHIKTDIKGIIVAYWSEIFERMMGYPMCYGDFFENIFWTECVGVLGYNMDNFVK